MLNIHFLLGRSIWPAGCSGSPSTSSSSPSSSGWCPTTTSASPAAPSCQRSMILQILLAGQIWQGEYRQKKVWNIQFTYFARCATAALAALLPTLLLRGRKVLTDPSPYEDLHLPPSEHASTNSEQMKEPCDNAETNDLVVEDTFRVLGVVDGKSWDISSPVLVNKTQIKLKMCQNSDVNRCKSNFRTY